MTDAAPGSERRRTGVDLGWSVLLAVLVLGPALLQPGFSLRGDMVFVPDQPWKDAWLGLDGSVPRAVPMDALVSAATWVLPGVLVQKLLLFLILVLGGLGAGRMVATQPWLARAAAITLFVWNPWVAERLLIGQWAILGGYAALPWVALAAVGVRDRRARSWAGLFLTLAVAAVCSPSSGLMACLVAVGVVLARPTRRALAVVFGSGVVANLPWLVPSLLVPGGLTGGDSQSFVTFAARGESSLGLLPSLLSLGGMWKSSVVPAERTNELVVLLAVLLTVVALAGLVRAAADRLLVRDLAGVALVSLLLAALPGIEAVAESLDRAAGTVPSLAILRDSHRYLGPAVLVLLPGVAAAVAWIAERARPGREALGAVAALIAVSPVVLLPGLAWGANGRLAPTDYPAEWSDVAGVIDDAPDTRTVVLPWTGSYRGFSWNRHRAMLDPAPRFLPGEVLIDDRILVDDVVLPSEDAELARVAAALDADDPAEELGELGVRWVLVEKGMALEGEVPDGQVVHDGAGLRLLDLGEPSAYDRERPAAWPIVLALLATCSTAAVAIWLLAGHLGYGVPRITRSLGGET